MNKQTAVFALMVLMLAPYKSASPQAAQDAAKSTEAMFPAAAKGLTISDTRSL